MGPSLRRRSVTPTDRAQQRQPRLVGTTAISAGPSPQARGPMMSTTAAG